MSSDYDQRTKDEMLRTAMWEVLFGCGECAIPAVERWLARGAVMSDTSKQKAIPPHPSYEPGNFPEPLGARFVPARPFNPLVDPRLQRVERIDCEHDFHTGNAPCSKCGKLITECGLSPGDDEPISLTTLGAPGALSEHARRYPSGWNRMDEVAHIYGLKRRNGEDDAVLATRVRRHASQPGVERHPVPPWDWIPPKPPRRDNRVSPMAREYIVEPDERRRDDGEPFSGRESREERDHS